MRYLTKLLLLALASFLMLQVSLSAHSHQEHWMAPAEAQTKKNPVNVDAVSIARGKSLFATHCASCHGDRGKGDGPAAKALDPKPADLVVMGGHHTPGDLAWKIANGRGVMPGWKGVLNENDIWHVVNYVQSLGAAKPHHH
jgi:mono/diheme cytochrome c family protein